MNKNTYYEIGIVEFSKTLENLNKILDKAEKQAQSKGYSSDILAQARLAPDQFPLVKQVQIACDTAKLCASRLTEKPAPTHADQEKNFSELKERIQQTITYLKTFSVDDFEIQPELRISQPRWEGKYLTPAEFFIQHAIPNFFFHITTAYSILRHNGVDIGKKDYLGDMPFKK